MEWGDSANESYSYILRSISELGELCDKKALSYCLMPVAFRNLAIMNPSNDVALNFLVCRESEIVLCFKAKMKLIISKNWPYHYLLATSLFYPESADRKECFSEHPPFIQSSFNII